MDTYIIQHAMHNFSSCSALTLYLTVINFESSVVSKREKVSREKLIGQGNINIEKVCNFQKEWFTIFVLLYTKDLDEK